MPDHRATRRVSWVAQLVISVILLQTLYFKLTAAPESVAIFTRLGVEPWGRIGSAVAELAVGLMLLVPRTAVLGALGAVAIISGAILAHLTVLGVEVEGDGGLLFGLACTVLVGGLVILWLRRDELPIVGRRLEARR